MTDKLGRITVLRKTGTEPFIDGESGLGFDLLDFWRWSASDLVANTNRGILAEYLVAKALRVEASDVRDAWAPYDLSTPGDIKIEVKSAAYLQTWSQKVESSISFNVPKTRAWDASTGALAPDAKRQADVYVFALLAHNGDKATLNPLDLGQWTFFVLATRFLDERTRSQQSITLASLRVLARGSVRYSELPGAVARAHAQNKP